MTKLYDDPASFSDDLLAGFLDVYADRVVGVSGGVMRVTETPPGKVAVVVGGGSGHYPAFCGVVGPGFADGAVVGNIFTSPVDQGGRCRRHGRRQRRRVAVQYGELRRRRDELQLGPTAAPAGRRRHSGGLCDRRHRQRAGGRNR
jgi:hypothetical protein